MSLKTFNDEKFEFLTDALGVGSGDIDDLEYKWLVYAIGVYKTLTGYETNADLWSIYLEKQGYPISLGTIQDRQVAWLQGEFSYTGTWNDMMRQFYIEEETESYSLIDVDGNYIKDVGSNQLLVIESR